MRSLTPEEEHSRLLGCIEMNRNVRFSNMLLDGAPSDGEIIRDIQATQELVLDVLAELLKRTNPK